MRKVKEIIEIPEAACAGELWLPTELVEKYPITNELEWELAKIKGYETDKCPMHFVSMIENPLYDPWGRKLLPWSWELESKVVEWQVLERADKRIYRLEANFRYSTVGGKPVCLYRYRLRD